MTISAFLKSADTASAPVHSMGRTRSKRLTSDRGHVIVIMWYEMWLIKGRQPLFRQTERYGLVALWLTDSFFKFFYIHMPLKLIGFRFILCLYNRGTRVTYFTFIVGSNSYLFELTITLLLNLLVHRWQNLALQQAPHTTCLTT